MKNLSGAVAGLFFVSIAAHGSASGEVAEAALDAITVVATGVSNMNAASEGDISAAQIAAQPLLRPGAILENIPGLIVTQHSGEGKANQYFLRAFNLDHGTDLALQLDDMPVNMPSHAHGQGYSDLNFVIPELVADLHYKKGPYYADEGDFATAGAARLGLLNQAASQVVAGVGEDGYRRGLLIGSDSLGGGTLLGAAEIYRNDGPFDVPDDYHRLNGVARFVNGDERDYCSMTGMAYSGRWNATDQVPLRAIASGTIDRFGTLNPSDGGISSRSSLSFTRVKRSDADQVQISAYLIRYELDLWSTFTYYLKDPANGDQMLQHDDRVVYGFKASKSWYREWFGLPMANVIGVQSRVDDIRDVGIFHTVDRQIIGTTQDAGVLESSAAAYVENTIDWSADVRSTVGLRADGFDFDVKDKMLTDPLGGVTGVKRSGIISPKLGIVLGPWNRATYFINVGDGYHSNDARGITRSVGAGQVPVTPLARARSAEVGVAVRIVPDWDTRLDLFQLKLQSELLFDGDEGVTGPSGATTRRGIEWGNTYHFTGWLSGDFNAAFTRARFDRNSAPDDLGCDAAAPAHPCAQPVAILGREVPNSPTSVVDAALTAQRESGWFGALRARHFGDSPLIEDGSAKSPAYTTIDAQLGFKRGKQWLAALDIFNVANVKWNDIEYYYVSRLKNESAAVPDYVVHPGVPRTLRARVQYLF